MCMAVHMLIKTASDLTAEPVNTRFNSGIPANILKKNSILMNQAMILFDKTAHMTGEILVISFE